MKNKKNALSQLQRLEIVTRNLVNTRFMGNYRSVFRGRGLEFDSYRNYAHGDDASLIDWKASSRANELLVKEFVEERNLNIFFLIDASSSMLLGSTRKIKYQYVAELISSLSYAIINSNDGLGFAMFADRIKNKLPPGMGFAQYYQIKRIIVNPKNYGGGYDFNKAMRFLLSYLKETALVIIISDFIGLQDNWKKNFDYVSAKFDIIGIMVRDPLDFFMPKMAGQVAIEDPYTGASMLIEPNKISDLYRTAAKQEESAIKSAFEDNDCGFLKLTTDRPFMNPLVEFFEYLKEKRAVTWK